MNNVDRMTMIKLELEELETALKAYEFEKKKNADKGRAWCLYMPREMCRSTLQRRILQLRQGLLALMKEL